MADLFLCGTMCHDAVLDVVTGSDAGGIARIPASLGDHAIVASSGGMFAGPCARPGATATGVLARGASAGQSARLHYYAAVYGHTGAPMMVETDQGRVMADVFRCDTPTDPGPGWDAQAWARDHGQAAIFAATEIMAWFGRIDASEMARRRGPVGIRAAARVAAAARPGDPDRDVARDVVVHRHTRPYLNFFAVHEMDLQFRRHDGTLGDMVNRGALMVGQAVVVLPYDPLRDCVLLVEQFRAPLFIAGDPAPWVWEPVAGLVDPGETTQQAARREAREEAGLDIHRLKPAGRVYSSTGSSGEFLNLFIGLADLPDAPDGGGGLASEGEDIRSRVMSFDDLMARVDDHSFCDMPLVTTALWLARHRERLRDQIPAGAGSGANRPG